MSSIIRVKGTKRLWRNRLGYRPPQDYHCYIPVKKIQNSTVIRAIDYVLDQISQHCYEDAVRLERKVWAILPLKATKANWKTLGLWKPVTIVRRGRMYSKGNIFLRDDGVMNYDLARIVFAHECGHAIDCGEYRAFWDESCVPTRFYREAAANTVLYRWGIEEIFERVQKSCEPQITWQRLKEIHQNLESISTYGQQNLQWSLQHGELEKRLGIRGEST